MGAPPAPILLDGGAGGVLAGHLGAGGEAAHVAVLRTGGLPLFGGGPGSAAGGWRAPALGGAPRHDAAGCATAAGTHHGVNRCGLMVACRPAGPVAASGFAGAVLGHAGGAEEAETLLVAAAPRLEGSDLLWLVDSEGGRRLELGPGRAQSRRLPAPAADGGLAAVLAALRHHGGDGRCTHGTPVAASALAARLDGGGEPVVLVCLGPPCCGVFLRQWPGIPPPPPLTWSRERPPLLGTLAATLATATDAGSPRRREIEATLARVEGEALAEGEEAERMARIMDAAGDDHGAEVRRALAQAHAADLAVAAMTEALGAERGDLRASL